VRSKEKPKIAPPAINSFLLSLLMMVKSLSMINSNKTFLS